MTLRGGLRAVSRLAALGVLLAIASPERLAAQQVAFERVAPLREKIRSNLSRARLHLGPIRLLPVFRLSNVGYTTNALGSSEAAAKPDYTATVQAGAGFVLPLGKDVFVFGEEAPAYNWYAHLIEQRHFGGRYGGSVAAFLRRFTLAADGSYARATALFSSELPQPVDQESRTAELKMELEIFKRLSIVTSGGGVRSKNRVRGEEPLGFQTLDNDLLAARAGVKYRFRGLLDVTALVEKTRQTFLVDAFLRDNQTTAYLIGLGYDKPKLYLNASAGYRTGSAYRGSEYPDFHGVTGGAFLSYSPHRRLEFDLGGSRNLASSLYATNPYYVETVGHAGIGVRLGHRLNLGAFGELSTLSYPLSAPVGEEQVHRLDHGTTFGGTLAVQIYRASGITLRVARTRYRSNVPGQDRTVLTATGGLALDAFLPREVQEMQ